MAFARRRFNCVAKAGFAANEIATRLLLLAFVPSVIAAGALIRRGLRERLRSVMSQRTAAVAVSDDVLLFQNTLAHAKQYTAGGQNPLTLFRHCGVEHVPEPVHAMKPLCFGAIVHWLGWGLLPFTWGDTGFEKNAGGEPERK